MIFKFVIEKFIEIFQAYKTRKQFGQSYGDPTVARLKLEESEKIIKTLSNYLGPTHYLKSDALFFIRAYLTQELLELANIRKRGTIPQVESELDGHVKTCINVLDKVLHYWSISSLSTLERAEVEAKMQLRRTAVYELDMETDPRVIFEKHLIEYMISVDMRMEMHKAPTSTANALFLLASRMVSSQGCHLEERLREDVYNQLIKIQVLLANMDPKSEQYFYCVEISIKDAFCYEASRCAELKYASSSLRMYLDKARSEINALPYVIAKQQHLNTVCSAVVKKSENFISFLEILSSGNQNLIEAARQKAIAAEEALQEEALEIVTVVPEQSESVEQPEPIEVLLESKTPEEAVPPPLPSRENRRKSRLTS